MKTIPTRAETVQRAIDDLDRPPLIDRKQYSVFCDARKYASGYDAALYIGPTVELKFYDFDEREWIEVDFLTRTVAFAWRKDGEKRIPRRILELVRKRGYYVYTNFERLPKQLQNGLVNA